MIEIRILERKVPKTNYGDGCIAPLVPEYVYVDVPQYRRGHYKIDGEIILTEHTPVPVGAEWIGSNWIDVPRVREE